MRVDKSNRRIKNLIDTELLNLGEILREHETFSKVEIEELDKIISETNSDLSKIDKNITDTKLRVTAEVKVSDWAKTQSDFNVNNISSNFIRDRLYDTIDTLGNLPEEEDFYSVVVEALQFIEGLCSIYIKKNSEVDNTFKEVEENYD